MEGEVLGALAVCGSLGVRRCEHALATWKGVINASRELPLTGFLMGMLAYDHKHKNDCLKAVRTCWNAAMSKEKTERLSTVCCTSQSRARASGARACDWNTRKQVRRGS